MAVGKNDSILSQEAPPSVGQQPFPNCATNLNLVSKHINLWETLHIQASALIPLSFKYLFAALTTTTLRIEPSNVILSFSSLAVEGM